MAWAPAWGPISRIGSSLIAGGFSAFGQSRANREARRAAQRQMDFQERMFRNRYQYTMADMRAAGLNPILAYQQGGGAAPGGASYTPGNVGAGAAAALESGASSAVDAYRARQDVVKSRKEVDLLDKVIDKTVQETRTSSAVMANQYHQGKEHIAKTKILDEDLATAKAMAARGDADRALLDTDAGRAARMFGTFFREMFGGGAAAVPSAAVGAGVGAAMNRPRKRGKPRLGLKGRGLENKPMRRAFPKNRSR